MAALAATAIIVLQSTWARRVQLGGEHAQAQLLIQTGLDWGGAVLSDDQRAGTADHAGGGLGDGVVAVPVDNGSLLGHIEDQQGANLNNLLLDGSINVGTLAAFRRLLVLLNLPPDAGAGAGPTGWTPIRCRSPEGRGRCYYLALPTPALAANRPLMDVAELADVAGFDANARASADVCDGPARFGAAQCEYSDARGPRGGDREAGNGCAKLMLPYGLFGFIDMAAVSCLPPCATTPGCSFRTALSRKPSP